MQRLIDIWCKEGGRLGQKFSNEIKAVIIFNDNQDGETKIQEVMQEVMDKFRYLDVWINNGAEYLTDVKNV